MATSHVREALHRRRAVWVDPIQPFELSTGPTKLDLAAKRAQQQLDVMVSGLVLGCLVGGVVAWFCTALVVLAGGGQ